MKSSRLPGIKVLTIAVLSLLITACQNQDSGSSASGPVPELPENPFFGKTDVSAYTPEVREIQT